MCHKAIKACGYLAVFVHENVHLRWLLHPQICLRTGETHFTDTVQALNVAEKLYATNMRIPVEIGWKYPETLAGPSKLIEQGRRWMLGCI
jgi:hypothetical protein